MTSTPETFATLTTDEVPWLNQKLDPIFEQIPDNLKPLVTLLLVFVPIFTGMWMIMHKTQTQAQKSDPKHDDE